MNVDFVGVSAADVVQTVSISRIDETQGGKFSTSPDGAPQAPPRNKDSNKASEGGTSVGSAHTAHHHPDGGSGIGGSPLPHSLQHHSHFVNGNNTNYTHRAGSGHDGGTNMEPKMEISIADPSLPPYGSSKIFLFYIFFLHFYFALDCSQIYLFCIFLFIWAFF